LLLPALGAASTPPGADPTDWPALLASAFSFHCFAYVLNDSVDYPIDRTEPRRKNAPLVRGVVSREAAVMFAICQAAIGSMIAGAIAGPRGLVWFVAALVGLTIYDVWGKRCRVPMVTDLVQGIGWASLVLYGAEAAGGPATSLTVALCIFVILFILMANGLHGGIRDIENDLRCGVRSTAIWLGVRPDDDGGVTIPRAARIYSYALQAALVVVLIYPLVTNPLHLPPKALAADTSVVISLQAVSTWFLLRAIGATGDAASMRYAGLLHLAVTLAIPIVVVAPSLGRTELIGLVLIYVGPLLSHAWFADALRWTRHSRVRLPSATR
jgi:4-hydroxybenzoate polyprenyltransferase